MTISYRIATEKDLQALSGKLLALIGDKDSRIYKENIARFDIPDEYVKTVFAEDALLKAAHSGKATFYLAFAENEIIGFAQVIQQETSVAELDRIIVFPEHTGKGIGTELLDRALADERRKGTRTIVVNAGKEETQARRFYEKMGFSQMNEVTIDAPWGKKLTLVTYQLLLK